MRKATLVTVALLALVVVGYVYGQVANPGDIYNHFLPAVRMMVRGENPYRVAGFFNPPWVLIPYIPLAFLPDRVAAGVWFIVSLCAWGYIAYRARLGSFRSICFLVSPPVVYSLALGAFDWLPLLGIFVPFPWNILLFLTKPQIGLGWVLLEASRRGQVGRWLAYAGIAAVVAFRVVFVVLGIGPDESLYANIAIQPTAIAAGIGVYVAVSMIRKGEESYASVVGPLLSPYVNLGNFGGIFLSLSGDWAIVLVVVVSWLILVVSL